MSKNLKEAASNRRRFERVEIDFQTGVFVTDKKHKRIGLLRQLGRGGMMVEPDRPFKVGKKEEIYIVDVSENLKVHLHATVRYSDARRVGFEFENLDANAAVDIGIIIGKYYSRDSVGA
jgi:c-di-GMP-binding flagellar brake protein YcgR